MSDPELLKAMVELFSASHKCPSGYEVMVSPIAPNASAKEMSTLTVRVMILKGGFFAARFVTIDHGEGLFDHMATRLVREMRKQSKALSVWGLGI